MLICCSFFWCLVTVIDVARVGIGVARGVHGPGHAAPLLLVARGADLPDRDVLGFEGARLMQRRTMEPAEHVAPPIHATHRAEARRFGELDGQAGETHATATTLSPPPSTTLGVTTRTSCSHA